MKWMFWVLLPLLFFYTTRLKKHSTVNKVIDDPTIAALSDATMDKYIDFSRNSFTQIPKAAKLAKWNVYTADNLENGLGFIDKIKLTTLNPTGELIIDLNPATVLTTYRSLGKANLNPNDLIIFSPSAALSDFPVFEKAIEIVVEHAIEKWGIANGLSNLTYDFTVNSSREISMAILGRVSIKFRVYPNPDNAYVNIDPANAAISFSPNGGTRRKNKAWQDSFNPK